MLISIIVVSLAVGLGVGMSGGGPEVYAESFDSWEKAIKKYVGDDREDEAKKLIKASKKSIKETQKQAKGALDLYFAVDQDYHATLDDYDNAIATIEDIWDLADKQLVEDRYKLKALLKDKEWEKCIKYTKKKMSKTRKSVKKAVKKSEKERAKQLKKIEKREAKEKKKRAKEES
jgi:uncharacterized protein YerC